MIHRNLHVIKADMYYEPVLRLLSVNSEHDKKIFIIISSEKQIEKIRRGHIL